VDRLISETDYHCVRVHANAHEGTKIGDDRPTRLAALYHAGAQIILVALHNHAGRAAAGTARRPADNFRLVRLEPLDFEPPPLPAGAFLWQASVSDTVRTRFRSAGVCNGKVHLSRCYFE